jgi:hypothetical protein
MTALLDALAVSLPGYGSLPFVLDEDCNIARGIIEKIGVGKIVLYEDGTEAPLPAHGDKNDGCQPSEAD